MCERGLLSCVTRMVRRVIPVLYFNDDFNQGFRCWVRTCLISFLSSPTSLFLLLRVDPVFIRKTCIDSYRVVMDLDVLTKRSSVLCCRRRCIRRTSSSADFSVECLNSLESQFKWTEKSPFGPRHLHFQSDCA